MICSICHIDKELTDFAFKNKAKNVRRKQCRNCVAIADANNYKNNIGRRQNIRLTWKKNRERNKAFIKNYFTTHPCVDCGEKDFRVLDFDHVQTKFREVSSLVHAVCSIENIIKEIDRCEVRCSNCHRKITWERRATQANLVKAHV